MRLVAAFATMILLVQNSFGQNVVTVPLPPNIQPTDQQKAAINDLIGRTFPSKQGGNLQLQFTPRSPNESQARSADIDRAITMSPEQARGFFLCDAACDVAGAAAAVACTGISGGVAVAACVAAVTAARDECHRHC
jgi:hypothetical protein